MSGPISGERSNWQGDQHHLLPIKQHRKGKAAMKLGTGARRLWPLVLLLPLAAQAQTYSRTDVVVYHDNLSKWVLGQTVSSTNTNTGVIEFKTDYDPVTAMPVKSYGPGTAATPGLLKQTLTYNANGTLASVKDGNNNVITLSSWYRGIPQSLGYPGGVSQSAVVNAQGWITSVNDENGNKTCYAYDTMGRITQVTYPSETTAGVCDGSAWNPTTVAFTKVAVAEYGIPAGHWRQTTSTGNARNISYFDAQWRPLVTHVYDAGNVAGTQSFQRFAYDHEGRATFASYPGTTDALTTGTWSEYDALGRATSVSQDSELGPLITTTQYLPGFQTRVTNPRGLQTTNGYQAWDTPTFDMLRWSVQPEGKVVEVIRDPALGTPQQLRQRNNDGTLQHSRYYVYDDYRQLCKTIEPETGATVINYDAAGNVLWSAAGHHDLPSTLSCNRDEGYWWGRRVDRAYDARNRLTTLAFPDGRGNQSWSYTPNGLPASITTYNDPGNGAPVINAYSYNRRGMLTGESSTQTGWYGWGIGYGYDANASLATHTYPTGFVLAYAPNALGQATQAGSYATGVQYYPNGAVKQFTYGNGITHTLYQNARQTPLRSIDSGGVLDQEYGYDPNGNVGSTIDLLDGTRSRWMSYDGLDRLTNAGSVVFGGDHWHRFTYDALDNMTSWKLGGVKDYANYVYEPGTNRLGLIQNSAGAGVVGFGYDPQGNLANKNGQLYTFDFGNRLRQTTGLEWYRYDGMGRRVLNWRWSESGVLSMYSKSGQLMYDENYRTSGRKTSTYIYLAGSLVAIGEWNFDIGTHVLKYQHTDALGSPVAVTNQAGTVIDRTNWEPYGAAIGKPAYDGVGYTGHVMDGATGLTYMQQRYYDPTIGRFLSVDPVTANSGTGGNFNRYWYANNNPYKFVDPDGRFICNRSRAGIAGCQDDPMGPQRPMPGNDCRFCLEDEGGDTPNTDEFVRSGGSTEDSSIGESLLKDGVRKLSDAESWRRSGEVLANDLYGSVKKIAVCAAPCALENFVGTTPKEVAEKIGQETGEKVLERGLKELDMLKPLKALQNAAAVLKIADGISTVVCSASCILEP
jgi:RHS repeat-associated protein